jgi:hypothetical protein
VDALTFPHDSIDPVVFVFINKHVSDCLFCLAFINVPLNELFWIFEECRCIPARSVETYASVRGEGGRTVETTAGFIF